MTRTALIDFFRRRSKILAAALILLGACLKLPLLDQVDCLRTTTDLRIKILSATGDGSIALAYGLIPVELLIQYWGLGRRPSTGLFVQFAAFIVLCGLTHVCNILRFWWPLEYPFALLKHTTGAVSLSVWHTLRRQRPEILALSQQQAALEEARHLAENARDAALHEAALAERAREQAEAATRRLIEADADKAAQIEALASRDRTIRALTSPILVVRRGVLLVPLVGFFDSARASELQDRLGETCETEHARYVILDLTGVEAIDTYVASALHRATKLVGYLGTKCIITGMRAPVANALVSLDIDLQIPTYNTLRDGLAAAQEGT